MNPHTHRAVIGSAERPTLSFDRSYPTDRQTLWSLVANADAASRWLGKIGGSPAAVGDAFTVFADQQPDEMASASVVHCVPGERLVCTWQWPGEEPSQVSLNLSDSEDGTRLRLTHSQLTSEIVPEYGGGWEDLLLNIRTALGHERGEFDEAHTVKLWQRMIDRALVVTVDLQAAPSTVWTHLSTAEGLKRWWWSHWSDVTIDADVREGGSYTIAAPSAGIRLSGSFLTVEPSTRLAFSWVWQDDDPVAPDEAVDIQLEPTASGTRLTVRDTGPWESAAPAESYRQGWQFVLGELKQLVEQ